MVNRIAALATVGASIVACSTAPKEYVGLEMIITADGLNAPKDFDRIKLEISQQADGRWDKLWDNEYLVPSQEATLPTTFTLLAGQSPREVLISVTAFEGNSPIVQRLAQVQVPTNRLADLWLILAKVCEGTVVVTGAEAEPQSTCRPGESCQPTGLLAGQCGSNVIPTSTLPTYTPGQDLDAGLGISDATVAGPSLDARPADTATGEASTVTDSGLSDAAGKGSSSEAGPQCTPKTCATLGYNCGLAVDGCGGTLASCGSCAKPGVCGANKPNVCGTNVPCTGLCQEQVACAGGTTTTVTGTVRGGLQEGATSWVPQSTTPDPVPGALVYIPNAPVLPFDSDPSSPQVQCKPCGVDVTGSPLVTTMTNFDGTFTLFNAPVSKSTAAGDKIPIVVQLGKWRRQFAFTIANSCAANHLPDLNLPSTSTEGDIPLTAISTGSYDPIECLLLKMGVAESEFTSYSTWNAETASGTTPKPGRVHIYAAGSGTANANPGATIAPSVDETVLMGTGTTGSPANGTYMAYDQILLPCWGDALTKSGAELANLGYYGDHGGHFFATHYSYAWLDANNNSSLSSVAQWDPKANANALNVTFTGNVSPTVPVTVPATNPGMFVRWLNYVGALSNSNPAGGGGATPPGSPTVTIAAGRHDVDRALSPSVDWIDGTDPNPPSSARSQMLLHLTFEMPVGQSSQCGRGIFSDFDVVSGQQPSNNKTFPNECDTNSLTPQERIIEYQLWNLASCLPGPPMSTCTPKTCADLGQSCGPAADGCGNLIANGCGPCAMGQTCGGGGTPGQCGPP
jgi:hypothetical protein